jgi:cytochrome c553
MSTPSIALTLIRLSKSRFAVKPAAIAAVLIASVAVPALRAQSDSELPAGPMQAKATTACAECHEARIIVQQRLSKAAWTKEVDKMTKWGALVDPQDRDALIDYLSANFGVDKPPYVADRTQVEPVKKPKK